MQHIEGLASSTCPHIPLHTLQRLQDWCMYLKLYGSGSKPQQSTTPKQVQTYLTAHIVITYTKRTTAHTLSWYP